MKLKRLALGLGAWLISSISWAAQPAYTVTDVTLHAEPGSQSSVLMELKAQTPVLILERQGGWYRVQVETLAEPGWVKLHQLRYSSTATAPSENLIDLALGDSSPTVATGVRGLSEAEIKAGVQQSLTLQRVNRYHVERSEAEQFAASGQLRARSIRYSPGVQP